MRKLLEKDIQRGILEYLAYSRKGFFWRNNSGAFGGEHKGKRWFVKAGLKGSADILGLVPPQGQFVAIEVKRPGEKQTDAQREFQQTVEARGGVYILAYSVEDVRERGL